VTYTIEYFRANWLVRHNEGWVAYNAGSFEDAVRWLSDTTNEPVRVAIVNPKTV
jgi:hypothetical protein